MKITWNKLIRQVKFTYLKLTFLDNFEYELTQQFKKIPGT